MNRSLTRKNGYYLNALRYRPRYLSLQRLCDPGLSQDVSPGFSADRGAVYLGGIVYSVASFPLVIRWRFEMKT